VEVEGIGPLLNFCANNYLGLADHPAVIEAARDALERFGFGMASVRFICGTQTLHKQLEERLSEFLGTEDTILFSSCFDANGGLFEALLGPDDAVISDALNHASIIDGIRLWANTARFRTAMTDAGFDIVEGTHPIVPVMLGDAAVSARFAELLWARGVYAISFSFPVVPRDTARIRTQLSAAHSFEDIDVAVAQFVAVKDELGV